MSQSEAFDPGSLRPDPTQPASLTQSARERLVQLVARIEKLEAEKAGVAADIKEVYADAKSTGFDTKALRKVIAIRKQDRATREELDMIVDLYLHATGDV